MNEHHSERAQEYKLKVHRFQPSHDIGPEIERTAILSSICVLWRCGRARSGPIGCLTSIKTCDSALKSDRRLRVWRRSTKKTPCYARMLLKSMRPRLRSRAIQAVLIGKEMLGQRRRRISYG